MIRIQSLDVVFGERPEPALPLIDAGKDREQIRNETGLVVGVRQVNLEVAKGEICVLMGLSGSGKSSLLRCVNGLNPVARGSVEIQVNGEWVDFVQASAQQQRDIRRNSVSMVFQKFALMPWLTVAQNVAMPLELQGLEKAEVERRVKQQLEIVGLAEWANHKPAALSGGMQQRVGLARALATESEILLMDEPFSALDPLIRNQLQDELLELQERLKKTIIFVSHDLDEALKLGTHIAIMKDAEIVQHGRPEDIVLKPANEYVQNFVAHTNPLNVLKAASIMLPIAEIIATETGYSLRDDQDYWLSRDLSAVTFGETSLEVMDYDPQMDIENLAKQPFAVPAHTPVRQVMEICSQTGHAVMVKESGVVTGVIGEQQLYHTMLGRLTSEAA
jgi:glycine betaine/proline transport system ATP-binding protein